MFISLKSMPFLSTFIYYGTREIIKTFKNILESNSFKKIIAKSTLKNNKMEFCVEQITYTYRLENYNQHHKPPSKNMEKKSKKKKAS